MIAAVLQEYDLDIKECIVQPFGSGLINNTWKVMYGDTGFILQRINTAIFKQPFFIEENIRLVAAYLKKNHPEYLFVEPVISHSAQQMVVNDNNYFRLFPFVRGSHTTDTVTHATEAFEAAKQFGAFSKNLSGFDTQSLKVTLPDFHNLTLRYAQFEQAIIDGNAQRIKQSSPEIEELKKHYGIVERFERIKVDPAFKLRVTHHDTKISNVLFDERNKGICVIDLDTIMPGYFFSDVGDMLRTYLSPANEEVTDLSQIIIRKDCLEAIQDGYLSEMGGELATTERGDFIYAGKFMIYMQALRFLTDHLNNDRYYGATYEDHNLMRAKNQLALLVQLIVVAN